MDQLQQFLSRSRFATYALLVGSNTIFLGIGLVLVAVFDLAPMTSLAIAIATALLLPLSILWIISNMFTRPLQLIWQAVMYLAPESSGIAAPKLTNAGLGQALTKNVVNHIYQLSGGAAQAGGAAQTTHDTLESNFVANSLALPLIIFNSADTALYANPAFLAYLHATKEEVLGRNLNDILHISFKNDDNLEAWLEDSKANRATSTRIWERVRLGEPTDVKAPLFDLIAYYNKGNPAGYETMLLLYDRTEDYSKDDTALSFVSLAVHELRTPLTMLRGYIEALEEELEDTLDPELLGFMQRMQTSAQQLATFVNNILNVARVEDGQMLLNLQEAQWQDMLTNTVEELSLRAKIHGITIKTNIAQNLPPVAVDPVSIYQVMSNLIDNAIKYSGKSKEIIITAQQNKEGLVETTVQDFGKGIPASAVPHLFEKFYRDHHNRDHVGGTGLGLYICKTFITGHGGSMWVQSKEGQGSTFGFTLLPYASLAEELKKSNNSGIVRSAHGWIKNHSLYRE